MGKAPLAQRLDSDNARRLHNIITTLGDGDFKAAYATALQQVTQHGTLVAPPTLGTPVPHALKEAIERQMDVGTLREAGVVEYVGSGMSIHLGALAVAVPMELRMQQPHPRGRSSGAMIP